MGVARLIELSDNLQRFRGEYAIYAENIENLSMENVHYEADEEVIKDWQGTFKAEACVNLSVN